MNESYYFSRRFAEGSVQKSLVFVCKICRRTHCSDIDVDIIEAPHELAELVAVRARVER
jgi:hypothetical protein